MGPKICFSFLFSCLLAVAWDQFKPCYLAPGDGFLLLYKRLEKNYTRNKNETLDGIAQDTW